MKKLLLSLLVFTIGTTSALACSCAGRILPVEDEIKAALLQEFGEEYVEIESKTLKRYQTLDDIITATAHKIAGKSGEFDSCTYKSEENGKIFHNCSNLKYKELVIISLDSGKICEVEMKIKQKRKSASAKVKKVKCE